MRTATLHSTYLATFRPLAVAASAPTRAHIAARDYDAAHEMAQSYAEQHGLRIKSLATTDYVAMIFVPA